MYLLDSVTKIPIPLKQINFKVNILQSTASFEMTQHYVNKLSLPLDTVFLFPIDDVWAITKICVEFILDNG